VQFPYVILPGDEPGPVRNQATVDAVGQCEDVQVQVTETSDPVEVTLIHPAMTVTKVCLTPEVPAGGTAEFEITITNTGDVALNYTTDDPLVGPGDLNPGESDVYPITEPCTGNEVCNQITVTWTIGGENRCDLANTEDVVSELACCLCTGEDGCTPGYWKNHPDCWCDRFDPDDPVCDVFSIPAELVDEFCDDTLMDAMNYGGGKGIEGKARNLLRHSVAGILNAGHNDVAYGMSADGVINAVNAALATLDVGEIQALHLRLADLNERGCPIDAHCRVHSDEPDEVPVADKPTDNPFGIQFSGTPKEFIVGPAVPNPFSHSVKIQYGIPVAGVVKVEIYDVAGRRLATLLDKEQTPGIHSVIWDGRNANGERVAPGVYFSRVRYNGESDVRKMIVME
jgi:hypothetical protein